MYFIELLSANSDTTCHLWVPNTQTTTYLTGTNRTNNSMFSVEFNYSTGKFKGRALTTYDTQYGIQVLLFGFKI